MKRWYLWHRRIFQNGVKLEVKRILAYAIVLYRRIKGCFQRTLVVADGMSEKRRDSKNRILRSGESQRKDGRYAYKYVDTFGKPQLSEDLDGESPRKINSLAVKSSQFLTFDIVHSLFII